MKKILMVFIFIGSVVNQVKAQLGNAKGNAFEISSASGTTTNNVMHKIWLLRNGDGDNWYTASLHDGIAVDFSFLQPKVNTRAWWERNPNSGTQMWGDMAQNFMTLAGGNLGLGTTNPRAVLDISNYIPNGALGAVLGRLPEGDGTGNGTFVGTQGFNTNEIGGKSFSIVHNFYGETNSAINFHRGGDRTGGFISFSTFSNQERMRIDPNGNVGIGTTTPREKLSVNGNIRAREIKVEATNWPDYVFEKSYKIETLQELESYIKTNKHLPEIPSAKEVATNGVELGEMNKLLLKKIEELTLYVIQLKKESLDQQKQLDELKKNKKQ